MSLLPSVVFNEAIPKLLVPSATDFPYDQARYFAERGAAGTSVAGYGQLWVINSTPCALRFTDDTGTTFTPLFSSAIGVSVQAHDDDLDDIAGLTPSLNDFMVYGTEWTTKTPSEVLSIIGAGTGTVTSVGGTGTVNGLTLTGTVTTSGNLTLGGTLSISNADWSGADLAVTNGGTGASDAATARANLGAGTGDGTVTSVGGTGTVNGLTLTGTVTTSGSLTLGGTLAINNADWSGTDLAVANGGTGASDAACAKTNLGFMTDLVDDTTPQLGGNLDLNAKGIVQVFTAASGNDFTIGQIGQVNTSNEMVLADASAYSTASGLLGMATGTINATHSGQFLLFGYITGLSGLTPGVQFLSETAGAMTSTAPSTASAGVRVLGSAPTSSTMWFQTSPDVLII